MRAWTVLYSMPLSASLCPRRLRFLECGQVEVVDAALGGHELVEERAEERLQA